jgi:magnesium transporter
MFQLKRHLLAMRRVIGPMRDIFSTRLDALEQLPGLERGSRNYFRDIWDHLTRIAEQIDSYRDVLSSAMDVYLSSVSNRTNDVMKQLTIIATVFLPLTFITGFFGQNFGWLVQRIDTLAAFWGLGVGALVVSCAILFGFFRRRGWL